MKNPLVKPQFSAKNIKNAAGTVLELLIYEEIGKDWWTGEGVTAIDVAAAIKAAGAYDSILLRINSPGGSCFEGVTIYNLIRSQGKPVEVIIDGMAASAASVIAMAGDTVRMGLGAMLMIHNAMWGVFGDANALRKAADDIENISVTVGAIYVKETGQSAEAIKALMDAETWLGVTDAIAQGFATEQLELDDTTAAQAKQRIAQFSLKGFKAIPAALKAAAPANAKKDTACECPCPSCVDGDCTDCSNDPCEETGCTCAASETMRVFAGPSLEMLKLRQAVRERDNATAQTC